MILTPLIHPRTQEQGYDDGYARNQGSLIGCWAIRKAQRDGPADQNLVTYYSSWFASDYKVDTVNNIRATQLDFCPSANPTQLVPEPKVRPPGTRAGVLKRRR